MYDIFDYINYYKEADLDDIKWNVMDNLVCAILVYLPVDEFENRKDFAHFCKYAEKYEKQKNSGSIVPLAFKILKQIKGAVRYQDMYIYDFENDRSNRAQFGAMTVRIRKNTVVVYKGTDHSIIGWMENFRIAYEYPTHTHTLAIEYLKKTINPLRDRNIYVTGHSKGGNLAVISAMEMDNRIFRNIKKVYNFDGPGLRKEEFIGVKYKRLEGKLENIVPKGSVVGMLLYNRDYRVVDTTPASMNDHHPDTWRIFGEFFVPSTLSRVSMHIHEKTIAGVEKFTYEQVEQAFETLFQNIEREYTSDLEFSPDLVLSFIKNMKDVDEEIRSDIYDIFKELLW